MKFKQITKDNSSNIFNISNTSSNDLYPVLSLGTSPLTILPSFLMEDSNDFLDGFPAPPMGGLLNAKTLKEIIEGYYLRWNRYKIGSDYLAQYNYYNAYTKKPWEQEVTEFIYPTQLSTEEDTLLRDKAIQMGYNREVVTDSSVRKGITYSTSTTKDTFTEVVDESTEVEALITSDDIYQVSEQVVKVWNAIRDYSTQEGGIINLDTELTEGAVCPVYYSEPLEAGFNCVTGTIYLEDASTGDLYKEYFSIHSSETCASKVFDGGVQVVLTSLKSTSSVLKLTWDPNLVSTAKIVRAKVHKHISR